ncbi:MAG: DegT/DnrJ/EryC1/StrS family aminotransferase [Niabella sp.]
MENKNSRRKFIKTGAIGAAGLALGANNIFANISVAPSATLPAILGGKPMWSEAKWIKWPIWIPEQDEPLLLQAMRSGNWSRSKMVDQFEKEWAKMLGVKRALATVNGTNALVVGLNQLGIGAGDEVLVPPYTFIATVQAVTTNGAIPVFVDVDPNTYQMDPAKIEAKITSRTKAILPVHILGMPADMDRIMAIAKKHNLIVLEDACQAHLAEINGKKVGTIGHAGCFSFQTSKILALGEGGALVSDDEDLMNRAYSFHNLGLPYGLAPGAVASGGVRQGTKVRISEPLAAVGLAQMKRLEAQVNTRNKNALYLTSKINDIPGVVPHQLSPNVTKSAYLLYAFRYKQDLFKGLSRNGFLNAVKAEGVPISSGYTPLNTQEFIKQTFGTKNYKKAYSKKQLNYDNWMAKNQCPQNDQLCNEAIWLTQHLLLGSKDDMDLIAGAIKRVYDNAEKIKKSAG